MIHNNEIISEFNYLLFCGQSNMWGVADNEDLLSGYNFPLNNVYKFDLKNLKRFNLTTPDYDPATRVYHDPRTTHGWDAYFLHDYFKDRKQKTLMAKVAGSGTGIAPGAPWSEKGVCIGMLKSTINHIRKLHHPHKVKFTHFFWSQGEAELQNGYHNQYSELLSGLFDNVKSICQNKEMNFIITKLSDNQTFFSSSQINIVQSEQDSMINYPNTVVVGTDNCEVLPDGIHFSANGCKQISDNIINSGIKI